LDAREQFSRFGPMMGRATRARIAFLAGVVLQTAESWDSRLAMVWLFYHDFFDRDALAALAAIVELRQDAEVGDAAHAKRTSLAGPGTSAAKTIDMILKRIASSWPTVPMQKR